MASRSTEYRVKVSGIIWDGGKAYTHYVFNQHPSRADVLERAGDFQQIKRIQVTRIETIFDRVAMREVQHVS